MKVQTWIPALMREINRLDKSRANRLRREYRDVLQALDNGEEGEAIDASFLDLWRALFNVLCGYGEFNIYANPPSIHCFGF